MLKVKSANISTLFKAALDSTLFQEILDVIVSEFLTGDGNTSDDAGKVGPTSGFAWLLGLADVPRFDTLLLFMSEREKDALRKGLGACNEAGRGDTETSVRQVLERYKL